MVKIKKAKKRAVVWVVPSDETADGRYHEVSWAKDGNLNAAHRRGHIRRFAQMGGIKGYRRAVAFARKKAKDLGVKATVHPW